jgi:hypothetical protein
MDQQRAAVRCVERLGGAVQPVTRCPCRVVGLRHHDVPVLERRRAPLVQWRHRHSRSLRHDGHRPCEPPHAEAVQKRRAAIKDAAGPAPRNAQEAAFRLQPVVLRAERRVVGDPHFDAAGRNLGDELRPAHLLEMIPQLPCPALLRRRRPFRQHDRRFRLAFAHEHDILRRSGGREAKDERDGLPDRAETTGCPSDEDRTVIGHAASPFRRTGDYPTTMPGVQPQELATGLEPRIVQEGKMFRRFKWTLRTSQCSS